MNPEIRDLLAQANVKDEIIELLVVNASTVEDMLSGHERKLLRENPTLGSVTTYKLRHLTWISWGKIVTALSAAGVRVSADPVGAFLAALTALWVLIGDSGFQLSETEAKLALILWRDSRERVPLEDARVALGSGDAASFEGAISKLLASGVIELEDGTTIVKRDRILLSFG